MTAPLIDFKPYQRRWLDDGARFKIGMFSRQTGKTFSTCAEIVRDCIEAEIAGRRARWVILSRGERQAAEAMDEAIKPFCHAFYTLYAAALRGRRDPVFAQEDWIAEREDGTRVVYKSLEVRFPGGSRITALPANPDTARGYSANIYLDEFALHKNSREIWAALFPIISKPGLKLRVTSTPRGKDNKFYELWSGRGDTWSRHRVTIHDAVADGLERDIAELRAGMADDEMWLQEYELEFLDPGGSWLSYDQILACEHPDAGRPDLYAGGDCLIGNDIARRGDLWVAWVWEAVGDVLWCREIVEMHKASFASQDAEIERLMDRYRVRRLVMDQTGMGEKPVEDARRRYGSRVEGVILSGNRRLDVAIAGRQAFEDRLLRIPEGNLALRADLHKLKRVDGPTGAPRLVADRDGNGHADRTWACFLAVAGNAPGVEYGYETGAEQRGRMRVPDWSDEDDRDTRGALRFGMGAW